jgi:hypothetical protein
MSAPYSRTGGARIGSLNATWPFASLSATAETLRLSVMGRAYSFSREGIRLSRWRGMLSTGLRIEHGEAAYPDYIVFWTFGFQNLKTQLEGLGYEVQS